MDQQPFAGAVAPLAGVDLARLLQLQTHRVFVVVVSARPTSVGTNLNFALVCRQPNQLAVHANQAFFTKSFESAAER